MARPVLGKAFLEQALEQRKQTADVRELRILQDNGSIRPACRGFRNHAFTQGTAKDTALADAALQPERFFEAPILAACSQSRKEKDGMKIITNGPSTEWMPASQQKESDVTAQRNAIRFSRRDAARKYNMKTIDAYLIIAGEQNKVLLDDVSLLGVGLIADSGLPQEHPVAVELVVGCYVVEALGVVRSCVKQGAWYRLGVAFTMLDAPDAQFLQELEPNLRAT